LRTASNNKTPDSSEKKWVLNTGVQKLQWGQKNGERVALRLKGGEDEEEGAFGRLAPVAKVPGKANGECAAGEKESSRTPS